MDMSRRGVVRLRRARIPSENSFNSTKSHRVDVGLGRHLGRHLGLVELGLLFLALVVQFLRIIHRAPEARRRGRGSHRQGEPQLIWG